MSSRLCDPFLLIVLSVLAIRCTSIPSAKAEPDAPTVAAPGTNTLPASAGISVASPSGTTVSRVNLQEPTPSSQAVTMPTVNPNSAEPGVAPGSMPPQKLPPQDQRTPSVITEIRYENKTFHYEVNYPSNFVPRQLKSNELAALSPAPVAGVRFENRYSQVANLEPPELSIYIYQNKTGESLDQWLPANGLLNQAAGMVSVPFHTSHVSGTKTISSVWIAPGIFYYVSRDEYIYRLTPLGKTGETMLETFMLAQ